MAADASVTAFAGLAGLAEGHGGCQLQGGVAATDIAGIDGQVRMVAGQAAIGQALVAVDDPQQHAAVFRQANIEALGGVLGQAFGGQHQQRQLEAAALAEVAEAVAARLRPVRGRGSRPGHRGDIADGQGHRAFTVAAMIRKWSPRAALRWASRLGSGR